MKKKTAVIFLTGLMIFTMSGYFVNAADTSVKEENENSNILIAYFTVPEDIDTNGIDADSGASVVVKDEEVLGNMEYMALTIQDAIGGDLFRIETKEAYPLDHEPLVDQAAEEQDENARPELATHIENPEQYDTILLGYPNWWGDMPQPLFTFLEEYDFSGKTIIPFNSHGGSGFSNTIEEIKELQPDANISDEGLSISRDKVADSVQDVTDWAKSLDLSEE
ncbi:flavodoxin [Blautia glucerasea]|uniref:flavodoxin n=1 Tax=Blautia glucerasea TaxID=536633 RepID=UPI001D00847D|nr:flavodoxin [Blautia glucerasea]MCB5388642.1 flavodoxin [Blautia glucerasea]MCB5422977.1 flavodoxin [Blautia luti]